MFGPLKPPTSYFVPRPTNMIYDFADPIAYLMFHFDVSSQAFAPAASKPSFNRSPALNGVPLANGAMEFDRVCREWRCKYTGDKATSESLEASK